MFTKSMLGEQITEILRERIVSGEYPAGHRLVERTLADEFGTSQGPIRDAIRALETQHLVITKPHSGTWVKGPCPHEYAEVFQVRAVLEELAGRLSPSHPPALEAIEQARDAFREAWGDRDPVRLVEANFAFHRGIVEATGNQTLLNSWDALHRESVCLVGAMLEGGIYDGDRISREHDLIFDALTVGDAEGAGRLLRQHNEAFAHALRGSLEGKEEQHESVI